MNINSVNCKKRISTWCIGILTNQIIDYAFDFILYPFIIWQFGLVYGFIIMVPLSFVACYLTILLYDWLKRDWLTIETIKEIKEYEGNNRAFRFLSKILRKSDMLACCVLSIKYDPFITSIYMRHGAHTYDGMSRRDWKIFITSLLIGNAYWSIVTFAGVSIIMNFKQIWDYLIP